MWGFCQKSQILPARVLFRKSCTSDKELLFRVWFAVCASTITRHDDFLYGRAAQCRARKVTTEHNTDIASNRPEFRKMPSDHRDSNYTTSGEVCRCKSGSVEWKQGKEDFICEPTGNKKIYVDRAISAQFWLYFFQSLDSSKTSLQVSDDPQRSNRPPLGAKSSVNGSPIAGQWSEHDDLQSPWERLRREMNLEAMSDTMSAGHTTPRNKGRANSIHTPSQSVQSNKLLGKVLNKHFKSGSNIAPRADASSVTSSVPKPTILMSDTTSSKGSPGINLSKVDHMSADDGEDGRPHQGYSPPRTIQFAVPHSQLVKTPAKEAAQMIVDDIMLTSGASPPAKVWKQSRKEDDRPPSVSYVSSSSVAEEEELSQHSTVDSWAMRSEQRNQDNVMMEGMGESAQQGLDPSEQFETMLGRRKTKTSASEKLNSPCPPGLWLDGNHTSSPGRSRFQLPGSPNLQRVYDPFNDTPRKHSGSHKLVKLTHANQPDTFDDGNDMLRKTGKLVDEDTLENYTQGMEQDFPFRTVSSEGDDNTGFVSHMPPSHNIMEASSLAGSDLGAGYELSGVLPIKASATGSPKPSEASITMTTGFSGQIPARFSLEYFPSLFQVRCL